MAAPPLFLSLDIYIHVGYLLRPDIVIEIH